MNHSDSLDTIHDLFAKNQPKSSADSDTNTKFQGDVYEELAQLEYIYVDDAIESNINDSTTTTYHEPISLSDFFEGLAQLATIGVVEVTDIVEAIHREIILRPLGRFNEGNVSKWQRGLTGRIYGAVRQVTKLVGNNLASALRLYKSILNQKNTQPLPRKIEQLVNVLNGVMGDRLVHHNNPLAISMVLYDRSFSPIDGRPQRKEISGRVIILCHGLCMSHLSWQIHESDSLGKHIIRSLPKATVLYLNYNTGQRISSNGLNFSKVLQKLVDDNPNISQIDLVGHSMGGLVARSALFYGKQQGFNWVKRVGNLITLGAPHHGASLERIGYFVQDMIAKLPFANSLARLGDLRSVGIIDLRHGSIRDADWQFVKGRIGLRQDLRHSAPLPSNIHSYFIAATLAEAHYDAKATKLLGDGLVTIESALGEGEGEHALFVPEGHKAVFYGVSHYNLIYNDRVRKQVVAWLLENGQNNDLLSSRIYSYPDDLNMRL